MKRTIPQPPPRAKEPAPKASDRAHPYIMKVPSQKGRFRSSESRLTQRFQRPRRREPPAPPTGEFSPVAAPRPTASDRASNHGVDTVVEEDEGLYENYDARDRAPKKEFAAQRKSTTEQGLGNGHDIE